MRTRTVCPASGFATAPGAAAVARAALAVARKAAGAHVASTEAPALCSPSLKKRRRVIL
jgi:hypothetical protein